MPRNPLEGLSRYINVDYREPDESVVDSIFGTYAERMDRDITKANLQLERDRLKYNADLAEQKYQQGRTDRARQNLVNDIQGTWTSMKDKPYWMIENQLSGIGSAYVDILGQDDVNSIMSRHNELEEGKRDGYGAASKNNYEIIQTLGNQGEITTAKGLIDLDNKFVFSADQGGVYNSARNIRAKTVLTSDRDMALAWDEVSMNHNSYDKAYPKQLVIKAQIEKDLGIHKSSSEDDKVQKQTALLELEKVDSIEETTKWKQLEGIEAWEKEATQVKLAYKRYQENPWLFIKETYKEPEVNAALDNPLFNPEYFAQTNVMTSDDIVNGALGVVDNLSSSIQATPLDTTSVDSVVNVLENIPAYGDDFSSYQESMPQYGADAMKLSDFVRGPDTEDPFVRTNILNTDILNDVSDIAAGNKTTDDVVNQKLESLTLTSSGEDSLSYDFDEASVDETNFKDVLPSYLTDQGEIPAEDSKIEMQEGEIFDVQYLSEGLPKESFQTSDKVALTETDFYKTQLEKMPTVEEMLSGQELFSAKEFMMRHRKNYLNDLASLDKLNEEGKIGSISYHQLRNQILSLSRELSKRINKVHDTVTGEWKFDKNLQRYVRPKGT